MQHCPADPLTKVLPGSGDINELTCTSDETRPLVSIYITTRNRPRLCERALQSTLSQTYDNVEIILVDDGSDKNDSVSGTLLADPRVIYIRNETCRGANACRNQAIGIARGKFITGLDDDDYFLPDRVSIFVNNWKTDDGFLYCDDLIQGKRRLKILSKRAYRTGRSILDYNFIGNQIFTKTCVLKEIGGFDETLKSAQEYDTWIRLYLSGYLGRRLNVATQVIDTISSTVRISSERARWVGHFRVYCKYKWAMRRRNRKNHLLRALFVKKTSISNIKLDTLATLVTRNNIFFVIRGALRI